MRNQKSKDFGEKEDERGRNSQITKVSPQNGNPGAEETITLNIEQQPGLFHDSSVFYVEFDAEMFYKNVPWTEAGGLGPRYGKCITVINNAGLRLFETLTVQINGQTLCNYALSELEYFATILNTDAGRLFRTRILKRNRRCLRCLRLWSKHYKCRRSTSMHSKAR